MSTSDQHGPTLTRKQLREASFTGSTPVTMEERDEAPVVDPAPVTSAPKAPLPRAAEPVVVPPAVSDDDVNVGAPPLTRRQARAQERILTGSVPTQKPSLVAAEDLDQKSAETIETLARSVEEEAVTPAEVPAIDEGPILDEPSRPQAVAGVIFETPAWDETAVPTADSLAAVFGAPAEEHGASDVPSFDVRNAADDQTAEAERPTVSSSFGETLLSPVSGAVRKGTASFDDLLSENTDATGSHHAAPSALIFSQSRSMGSLSGPVASTGEILITGTMNLPEGLGSRGHAIGAADGKDVDSVLLDRELAPGSSPTPIAASAAISTIKPAGEVIRPPEPDKGNKVMLALTITAGALALALVGALVVAFTTGVFS